MTSSTLRQSVSLVAGLATGLLAAAVLFGGIAFAISLFIHDDGNSASRQTKPAAAR